MSTTEQFHSGTGDNVVTKYVTIVKSLAPDELRGSMDLVFESLRKSDLESAKTQMAALRAIAQQDPEAAALMEAVSVHAGLLDAEGQGAAWKVVSKIISTATNEIVKDVCLAALLQLSQGTDKEEAATEYYQSEACPGPYSREIYLRFYADADQLETAARQFVIPEGELTGIAEGAFRLGLTELAISSSSRLHEEFASDNSRVIRAMARGLELNPDLAARHLWLCRPDVKQSLDDLAAEVAALLEHSKGQDARVYNMACPIFETYNGYAPAALYQSLKKYQQHLGPAHEGTAARFKAIAGDDSELPQWHRDIRAAKKSSQKRKVWCRRFLESSNHTLDQVMPFIHLATSGEIEEWLGAITSIDDASEMETAFVRLFASAYGVAQKADDLVLSHELSDRVDIFMAAWMDGLVNIVPDRVFELAEKLFAAKLAHKAVQVTSKIVPQGPLWPSPFVVTFLKCLLETQQYKTFDDVVGRVSGADKSISLLSLQSLSAERLGDVAVALKISDHMVALEPTIPHVWYRGCYLRERYGSDVLQREFQKMIPDSVLQTPSPEVIAILHFLARAGNFQRAEPLWVEWFLRDPAEHAVALINFYFGLSLGRKTHLEVSDNLDQCVAAIQYEQDGVRTIRLIVEDDQPASECTLKASSPLAELLQSLSVNESAKLGMTTYKVQEYLPPYVACLRYALKLRHTQNDGTDCFAMLRFPTDPTEIVPFLEETLAEGSERRRQLGMVDSIPLYMRGQALFPDSAFKAALSCWGDVDVPKSPLFSAGDYKPSAVVLDAYGISFLAITDLAERVLSTGVSFVLPASTKEALGDYLNDICDDAMMLGVTTDGRLSCTTSADLRDREGHMLRALQLILDQSTVMHPVAHDAELETYFVRGGVDRTVSDAMHLSMASKIPWLCMDGAFAQLHNKNEHPTANVEEIILRVMGGGPFDFDRKRHALMLYAVGALPLPLTFAEIYCLAETQDELAGFILFKIIQNHGRQIFIGDDRPTFLLDVILAHLRARVRRDMDTRKTWRTYSAWKPYTDYVFNHGMDLYLASSDEGSPESRLAAGMVHMGMRSGQSQMLVNLVTEYSMRFALGRFMSIAAIKSNLESQLVERTHPE